MTINPTASAKLDQVAKEALDALYAERMLGGPELAPLIQRFNRHEVSKDEFVRGVEEHFGNSREGNIGLVTFVVEFLAASEKTKRAADKYVETRQLIESLTSA